ncbi:sensor histidine kinase [Streptomyces sp. NBC_00316]|uniref:sensor histidine kinase n=1 Tax=Streptomyces sp. NBC_00316 TaxID=2975710 RepID=UPI002E2C4FC2|nr:HAMP domain-containing sensor histidine kinase [Streptomyces sp. NBC_00316]
MRFPTRWIAARRGSLRLRLTAVFGLLFFLAAAVVLAATLLLVHRYREHHTSGPYMKFDPSLTVQQWQEEEARARAAYAAEFGEQDARNDVLWMLKWGSLVVVGVGVTATGAGWLAAGKLLQPLTRISNTAERVAGRTLHQRIALNAPPGEVKALADSFDRMLERLDASFAGQGRFIANAAHELKTPLVINRTLVEVAMNRRGAPAQMRDLGENLLAVNVRHERLVDALLTLARSENGEVARLPADLGAAAATVLEATAPAAGEAGVTLHADLHPAPMEGDPVLLEQLARNLVDNAVRYNVPGGTVRVWTGTVAEGVRLTVANTGPVIAGHEVHVLFQPFRRLTERVGSARGSGLGLSIVQAVARAHGGDADAEAHPDGGLTVTVTLPVTAQTAPDRRVESGR